MTFYETIKYTLKDGVEGYRRIVKEKKKENLVITSDKMFQYPNEAFAGDPTGFGEKIIIDD